MITSRQALEAAIASMGTQTLLAQHLTELLKDHPNEELRGSEVTQAHVANWLRRDRVPPNLVRLISAITGVEEACLRPDVFYDVTEELNLGPILKSQVSAS